MDAPQPHPLSKASGTPPAHSALMDLVYRRQRHIYDASRKYFLFGRDRLIEELRPEAGDRVLEIGCGTGRNLIMAARRYPEARLFGVDISEAMLRTARASIARAGLSHRITVAAGDATTFAAHAAFGVDRFDRVFVSYALSMIPNWRAALSNAYALTAGGGRLHVVDFGQQERLPGPFRALLRAWLRRFHVEPRSGLAEAVASLDDGAVAGFEFRPLLGGYCWLLARQR